MGFSFFTYFGRVGMAVASDQVREEFDFSPTMMGAIYSAFLITYLVGMIPGGWLIDRFGSYSCVLVMGLASAGFGALTVIPGLPAVPALLAFPLFLLVRGMMGLFSAPIYPASSRTIAQWIPRGQRGWANGLVTGAAPLGIASVYLLFGASIDAYGWRIAFVLTGACTAVLAVLWYLFAANAPSGVGRDRTEDPKTTSAEVGFAWRRLYHNRSLLLLALSYGAVGYFEYLLFYWIEFYFKEVVSLGAYQSRLCSTIATSGMILTLPLGGWLSDRLVMDFGVRLGRALVPAAGMLVSAAALYLAVASSEVFWIVFWFTLALGAIGATEGPIWATAVDLGGEQGATAGAICNAGCNCAGLISPVLTPLIGQYLGWGWGLNLASLVCLLGSCMWFWIDPRERA